MIQGYKLTEIIRDEYFLKMHLFMSIFVVDPRFLVSVLKMVLMEMKCRIKSQTEKYVTLVQSDIQFKYNDNKRTRRS